MHLFSKGEKQDIIIDTYFPYTKEMVSFGATTTEDEYWLQALEKALAKLYGTYARVEKIPMVDIFYHLLGCYVQEINKAQRWKPASLWKALTQAMNARHLIIIIFSTKPGEPQSAAILSQILDESDKRVGIEKIKICNEETCTLGGDTSISFEDLMKNFENIYISFYMHKSERSCYYYYCANAKDWNVSKII